MNWDITNIKNWDWRKHPRGGLIRDAGNAKQFKTGGWRSARPQWDEEKCVQCLICHIFCPDSSIKTKDEKMTGIDYNFCKGCGICAHECPHDAIAMIDEAEALKKEESEEGRS
jgi:pyruvate ferredoxin oxidoreductase delta subunit